MKKRIVIAFVLLLIIPSFLSNLASAREGFNFDSRDINHYDKGYRYNIQGWVYIHIEGEPYERGYQYGYLATAEIIDTIYRWSNMAHDQDFMKIFFIKNLPKNYDDLSEQMWEICRTMTMKNFIDRVPEEYQQEMRGIVDGIKDNGGEVFGREIQFEDIAAAHFIQECIYSIKFSRYKFHPFQGIFSFDKIKSLVKTLINVIKNPEIRIGERENPGHCSAFIATGSATADGGIVVGHSTHFNLIIAERCNIILDVQPSSGYRFLMTCVPGSMWSQEDYYQNEQGIILTETELPQGPWKMDGTPKGVRGRNAIQYSKSIDEVIENLMDGNNGLIPNEWLIGDIKTGEIASMEQALFNTPVKRTCDGCYYSYNAPHDTKVRRELFGAIDFIPFLSNSFYYMYSGGRDKKFEELGNKYYGKIDTENAKEILGTHPICVGMTDGKITSSDLMQNLGFLAFMGLPDGDTFTPTEDYIKTYHGLTELPPNGWVRLYPSISEPNGLHKTINYEDVKKTGKVLWRHEVEPKGNMNSSYNIVTEDAIYTFLSPSILYAIDAKKGDTIWNKKIDDKIVTHEVSDDLIIIGTEKGISAINKATGNIEWYKKIDKVSSKPVVIDNLVITSFSNGDVYAFDIKSGQTEWSYDLPYSGVISEVNTDFICIGSDKKCYCLNINSKEKIWEFETGGRITTSPKIYEDEVYVGSWDGNLYSLDLYTGEEKWEFKTGWGIDSTPAVSNGMVYFGSNDNNFYALDEETGELKWYFTCKAAIQSSPTAYGEYIFFGSDDGRLYALDKNTGGLAWNFAPGYSIDNDDVNNYITTPISSDPVVKNGVVYIGAKGNIYALDAQTTEIIEEPILDENKDYDIVTIIIYILLILLGGTLLIRTYLRAKNNN